MAINSDHYDVTVAIIHRNMAGYLDNALRSALGQKTPGVNTEILLLDDASTDQAALTSWDKLRERFERPSVRFVNRSVNVGVACMRNLAVRLARGEVIMFVDADDTLGSCYVQRMYLPFTVDSSVDWVTGDHYVRVYHPKLAGSRSGDPPEYTEVTCELAMELASMSAYRVNSLTKIGGWAPGFDRSGGDEGYECATRMLLHGCQWTQVTLPEKDCYRYLQRHLPTANLANRARRRASIEWCKAHAGRHACSPIVRNPGLVTTVPPHGYYPVFDNEMATVDFV